MGVSDIHDNTTAGFLGKCKSHHAGNEEHENRKEFEITGRNCTTARTCHDFAVIFTFGLSEYTLYNMLVCTPIPKTDD